jgi:hypothetical protein
MTNTYQKLTTLSLALLLVFSPTFSYAKEKNEDKERKDKTELRLKVQAKADLDDEKEERSKARTCVKAFGHLIAPGFIKNKDELQRDFWNDCVIPFGIAKKLGMGTSTPNSGDTEAPAISSLSVNPKIREAIITWKTNERSDTKVYWSTSSPVSATSSVKSNNNLVTDHRITLGNLKASTTYYFVVSSKDKAGNLATSSQMSFTTKGENADVAAPMISNVSVTVGTSTANVSWSTNEDSSSRVYWSTINPLNLSATTTASTTSNVLTKNHVMSLSGLSATTTYFLKVESTDQSGNTSTSATFTTTTN